MRSICHMATSDMATLPGKSLPGKSCNVCENVTKYQCLRCNIAICNKCSTFGENEDVPGWKMGKAVGFCNGCFTRSMSREDPFGIADNMDNDTTEEGTTLFIYN